MKSPVPPFLPSGVLKMLGMLRKQKMFRRWLWSSPAGCNDCFKLELPGAWEPPDSSKSLPFGEDEETHLSFLDGN